MALLWSNIDYRSLKITGFEVEINLYLSLCNSIFNEISSSLIHIEFNQQKEE